MSFTSGEELGHAHPTPTLPSDCDFSREDIKTSLLNGPVRLQPPEGGVQADLTARGAQHAKREVFRLQRRRRKASALWRCR